ncbi:hypothetical protein VKT23_020260 [Stygiomarasmius scandens]|uniref:Uncharacterized protein n=1 Tax=Marasmiellus scandens TaxID=2682957 RepID=A0ABR1IJG9_9AGAR
MPEWVAEVPERFRHFIPPKGVQLPDVFDAHPSHPLPTLPPTSGSQLQNSVIWQVNLPCQQNNISVIMVECGNVGMDEIQRKNSFKWNVEWIDIGKRELDIARRLGELPTHICERLHDEEIATENRDPSLGLYNISDQGSWYLNFILAGFDIKWMSWSDFFQAVLRRAGPHWSCLQSTDLIVGGFGCANNFLETFPLLTPSNFPRFWKHLLRLSENKPMWPGPLHVLPSAAKIGLHVLLGKAAAKRRQYPHPHVYSLDSMEQATSALRDPGLVVKREYSDCGEHVFVHYSKKREDELRKAWEDTKSIYQGCPLVPAWFAEPFSTAFAEKGEIRAYLANGLFVGAVYTEPMPKEDRLFVERVDRFTPLNLLEPGPGFVPSGSITIAGNKRRRIFNEDLDKADLDRGEAEFRRFVEETVAGLIEEEEKIKGQKKSSLRVFCRVDVGLILDGNGEYHYYASEVERSLTVGLFRCQTSVHVVGLMQRAIQALLAFFGF